MLPLVLLIGGLGAAWYLTRGFETKLLITLAALPFTGWFQAHVPGVPWSILVSGLVAGLGFHALIEPHDRRGGRPAHGLAAVVLAYAAVCTAQAFSPDLPSALLGLRGLRLVLEPIVFFFVGAEVAGRPALLRRALIVVLLTGAVVVLYALKQWITGFDGAERRLYRATFAVALRERRIFSTLPGASALGHYAALVVFAGVAWTIRRERARSAVVLVILGAAFTTLLTGQRGVIVAMAVSSIAVVGVALARPEFRARGARAGQVIVVVGALVLGLVLATPVQDRRNAASPSQSAFESARIKLALLRQGTQERSVVLRAERLSETLDAVVSRPLGAGTGLNLLVDPGRSARSTFLGRAGLGEAGEETPLPPRPGELYLYTLGSEQGVVGLGLWLGLALFGLVTAAGVALRHPDRHLAAVALAACGYFVFVLVDALTVDAMAALPVAAWFWLFLGLVGRWAQSARVLVSTDRTRSTDATLAVGA